MDKPRHPLVIRPWKLGPTERNKWKVPLLKTSTTHFEPKPSQKSSTEQRERAKKRS